MKIWINPPKALAHSLAARPWQWQGPDFYGFLPLLAWLPTRLAYRLAAWRGRLMRLKNRDWAELSVGEPYVGARTAEAMKLMHPAAPEWQTDAWVRERYVTVACEDLEARWIINGELDRFTLKPLADSDAQSVPADTGVVLIQPHFNNPVVGCIALAQLTGRRVWATISSVMEHEQIHPAVSRHFYGKCAGAERWLNGGKILSTDHLGSLKLLYKALAAGDIVVVMGDLPAASGSDGVCVDWMGQRRTMAAGALRMAVRTKARIGAVWTDSDACGNWQLGVSVVPVSEWGGVHSAEVSAVAALQHAFDALSHHIFNHPGRWWAAHLLPETPLCNANAPGV